MTLRSLFALAALAATVQTASAYLFTFEEGVGQDAQPLQNVNGISFTNDLGDPWVYLEGQYYNCSSWPGGEWGGDYWINGNVGAWCTQNTSYGKILVDNADATYFEVQYSVGSSNLYLEAYDSSGNLLDADSGPANLRFGNGNGGGMGTLQVQAPLANMAYVIIHDTGNYWVIDNVSTDATGIYVDAQETPAAFQLAEAAPNPFNPATVIRFSLDEAEQASLKVYDMAGRQVATLFDGMAPRGETRVRFDASELASGVYLYTLTAAGQSETRKMVLVK